MLKSVYSISKMDCPSEENLIRMKLDGFSEIKKLDFEIEKRELTIYHERENNDIELSIHELNLNAKKLLTEPSHEFLEEEQSQRSMLWAVLAINFVFFVLEMGFGLISKSMGLVADSLDMLADSFVYGISLIAVGKAVSQKKNIAKLAGYFQITLALIGFFEVLRRFFGAEEMPNFSTMIVVSALALVANGFCLYLLQKSKSKEEAHMKASMIFTSNDVIINAGVILAGLLVYWLNSNKPDLIIGTIVFVLVVQGALRILKLGK
ncbi:MAG: cation transporter [Bacteroidia bacterium]